MSRERAVRLQEISDAAQPDLVEFPDALPELATP